MLFIVTFAVFGLLLGFAAIHDTNQEQRSSEGPPARGNETDSPTQGGQSNTSDIVVNQESG
ncbi:MAG: hypothetical protein M3270_07880 [Thermoproteota archaeon]|nr:hypothetical protein [Thermoproteota archaeon]